MNFPYEKHNKPRAAGPKDESARKRIPEQIGEEHTQNLQDFKSDTITRNWITPGDGCRMVVSTPPPMCCEYAGEYARMPRIQFLRSRRLIQTPPRRNILFSKSLSGVAGGKTSLLGIKPSIFVVKLSMDGVVRKAVVKKNLQNLDDMQEPKGKGEISHKGAKRTVCSGHHIDRQRITSAGCSVLISTKNTHHERGNPYVALTVFNIGQREGESRMPIWRKTPVRERWPNKRKPWGTSHRLTLARTVK
jgi:hypothetical protein